MKKLILTVELTFDDEWFYGDSEEGKSWFMGLLTEGDLSLHESGELSDELGTIKVLEVKES